MEKDSIDFSFSWKAMQLLGKSLYSNAWSAVSELVANGLDAGANNVHVLIDASNKSSSIIEIMDDGKGMDRAGLSIYAKVGYDRRENSTSDDPIPSDQVMGRKGIGKLAALYLTDNYYIKTKQSGKESTWEIVKGDNLPDDNPRLEKIDNGRCNPITPDWAELHSGTIIVMRNVNLNGIGDAGFEALSARLANQFLVSSMNNKEIKLCVRRHDKDPVLFAPVEKNVAFKNFSFLASAFDSVENEPADLKSIKHEGNTVKLPLTPSKDDELVTRKTELKGLESLESSDYPIEGVYGVNIEQTSGEEALATRPDIRIECSQAFIPYKLTGWIGLHATIKNDIATENDPRFEKNKFYNPAQIRLYVRNKLASEELLNKLGITVAFANYIEGEISFDLLDDNVFPDIATSNRQGFDELDGRWELLKNIIRPIVRQLINERQKIASELKTIVEERQTSAKSEAFKTVEKELADRDELDEAEKADIGNRIISQFQGSVDLRAKEDYKVFLSHKSEDKLFTDFVYDLLLKKGARRDDFFYTSSEYDPERLDDISPLATQIKKNIVSDNTLIAYFTSPHFLQSQYCLFEGGAGWATRSVDEYLLMSTTYDGIPKYLTNGKTEMVFAPKEKVVLDQETYHYFVRFLNRIIEHINIGRNIRREKPIEPFPDEPFPDKVEMKKKGTSPRDYMDKTFLEFWDAYIDDNLDKYLFRNATP